MRRPAVALVAVFIAKLTVVLQLKHHPLLQADAGLDTTVYIELATRVLAGNISLAPGLYFVSPLYIYFVAAVQWIADSLTAVRLVQIALGTAAVAFVFVAAREWFGRGAAWCAAAAAALTGLFTFYETLVLQAAVDPFLTAGALAALALALNGRASRWSAIAGAAFGLEVLNRPNALIAVSAILAVLLLVGRRRSAAFLAAGMLAALSPVIIRNAVVSKEWSLVSSHGGLNFYIGNNPEADGTYHSVPGITPNIAGQQEDARKVAERAVGHTLEDAEVSEYFYRQGLSWIASNHAAAARLFVRKLLYALTAKHLWLNYSYAFFSRDEATLLSFLIVGPWILVPLGLAGLVVAAPANWRAGYAAWVAFVPAYVVSVAIFFASERYRLPLLTPLCIGAGGLAIRLLEDGRVRNMAALGRSFMAIAVLAAIVNWPLALDDGRAEERVRMAEHLIAAGRVAEADVWVDRALTGHPMPALVRFRIGRALLAQGRAAPAIRQLQEAERIDPQRAEIGFALGQALLDAGRASEAVPHLRRALDAGVRPDLAGYDLARALAATGDRAGALRVLEAVHPADEQDAASWYMLGQLAEQLTAADLAAAYYKRAADAAPQLVAARERYGLMLAVSGHLDEAARQLERAVALDPGRASLHLNLAVAYGRLGRVADARAQALEALRLDPSYQKAREVLRALPK